MNTSASGEKYLRDHANEIFGDAMQFLNDQNITDIDINGIDVWVRDRRTNERIRVTDKAPALVQPAWRDRFTSEIGNLMSKPFNQTNPKLEADTSSLRISIVHESKCNGKRSICIRKTPPTAQISTAASIETNYADRSMLSFLANCVTARTNILVAGEPGTGKTELVKYLSLFIKPSERVITIEDSRELRYSEIRNDNPDCVEFQVDKDFSYQDAIFTSLRQNPNWLMIAEIRGKEIDDYSTQLATGVNGMSTIHTDDVRHIPARCATMSKNSDKGSILDTIYSFINVGVLIDFRPSKNKDGSISYHRYIKQICVYDPEHYQNYKDDPDGACVLLVDNGKWVVDKDSFQLPTNILNRFRSVLISNPFKSKRIDDELRRERPTVKQPVTKQPVSKPAVRKPPLRNTMLGAKPKPMPKQVNPSMKRMNKQ